MLSSEINQLTKKVVGIEIKFEEFDIAEIGNENYENSVSEVYELEEKISEFLGYAEGSNFSQLKKLQQRLMQLKSENDFYDEDAELDNMFPNRHDDDFDEDSMSYDSVFGGD
jgi:hypothetical protein